MYQREHGLGEDDPVPPVQFGYYGWGPGPFELERELEIEEPCFLQAVSQFFLQEITLEQYFDRLIGHLQADAERHTFDNVRKTKWHEFLGVDLIAGAVKYLMLKSDFVPLQETGTTPRFIRRCCYCS